MYKMPAIYKYYHMGGKKMKEMCCCGCGGEARGAEGYTCSDCGAYVCRGCGKSGLCPHCYGRLLPFH